jgi:hypothetical protein
MEFNQRMDASGAKLEYVLPRDGHNSQKVLLEFL